MLRVAKILTLFVIVCASGGAVAFTGQDEQTPGYLALQYARRSHVWSRLDLGGVDAQVKTSPPGSVRFDRRAEGFAVLGFDAQVGSRLALRLNVKGTYSKQRQSQKDQAQSVVDQTQKVYIPSADLTFITSQGLEIFAGAEDQLIGAYNQKITSVNGVSTTHVHKSAVLAPHIGVVRRAGTWSGGFYYVRGGHVQRDIDQSAFDGSGITSKDVAFVPPRLGVMGAANVGRSSIDFELGFVQARGQGLIDDKGRTIYADYFQSRIGTLLDFGGMALKSSVFYQTQSYASSAYVTTDTMPVSALKLLLLFGAPTDHAFIGVTAGYGKDGQSQPEFNASYRFLALAPTMGVLLTP